MIHVTNPAILLVTGTQDHRACSPAENMADNGGQKPTNHSSESIVVKADSSRKRFTGDFRF